MDIYMYVFRETRNPMVPEPAKGLWPEVDRKRLIPHSISVRNWCFWKGSRVLEFGTSNLPLVVFKPTAGIQHLKQEDHKRMHLSAIYYTQESLHKSLSFHYQHPYCQNTFRMRNLGSCRISRSSCRRLSRISSRSSRISKIITTQDHGPAGTHWQVKAQATGPHLEVFLKRPPTPMAH